MSLTSAMVRYYNKGNLKAVISHPVFMINSDDLMNHSEAEKKMVETFNSQDKIVFGFGRRVWRWRFLNSAECKDWQ